MRFGLASLVRLVDVDPIVFPRIVLLRSAVMFPMF